ncbi:hypothetical protein VNI00_002458 [Paramarasmius palmivorus]|uniref:Uncharacterized protein n=1 Tax=Paramarasmius palmivorus TaxID=297713 RepID=A0AAW0DVR8_9AGAR
MVRVLKSLLFVAASFVVSTIGMPTAVQKTGFDVGNDLENINVGHMSPLKWSIDALPTDPTLVTQSQVNDVSGKLASIARVLGIYDGHVLAAGTFGTNDGQYVLAELGIVQLKLNPCLDTLAAKAATTFSTNETFKGTVGQQLVALYSAYDTFTTHIVNASPVNLKDGAQTMVNDCKGHLQQAINAYKTN